MPKEVFTGVGRHRYTFVVTRAIPVEMTRAKRGHRRDRTANGMI